MTSATNSTDIGDIEDIVVDLRNSRVHYVVVEFDRAWNPNDKLVALPMKVLRDGATAPPAQRDRDASAPPQNAPGFLSLDIVAVHGAQPVDAYAA